MDANPLLPSSDVPKAIADQQTVVSTLTVSGRSGPVQEVQVQVNITHTWDADLDVYLLSPQGTRVELFTDVGSSGDNFTDTILDDQAGAGVASGSAPFTGTYRPEGALSALAGQDPNGIWRLEITDDAGGDAGTLHGWALRITTAAAQPQSVPYEQVFATGQPGAVAGWEYYSSNEGRIEVVGGRLRMDDAFGNATASLNEALLHVNLTGKTGVQLVLDHWSLSDENTPLATSFTGHYNGDGIALSVDGVHWVKVTDLTGSFTGQSFALDSVLLQAQMAAGSTDLSNVRIKFQQFDDYPSPDDGREFDNIRIEAATTTTPEIGVFGNGVSIAGGDIIPSAADGTDFGSVPAGSTGVRTFTITNSGSGVLHLTGTPAVELLGSGGAFVVVQPPSALVSAGGSTSFQIAYTPAGVGLSGATVRIANDDGDENPYDFVIQGTGVQDPAAWVVSADAPKAIADQQTVVSTLTVSGRSGPLVDVEVQVNISHTWDADLDVYLISPSGTRVELFTDVGSSGDNFTDTILDDQAGAGVASGSAPFTGTYRPEGALSALAGQDPNGIWRLEITDDAGGDVGTLHGWALRITTTTAAAPEIAVFGNGVSIADGDIIPSATDGTDFGAIVQAGPTVSRTFTVQNSGSGTLTLGAVTVPAGFTLTEGLSGSLAPGASDMFTVRLDNAVVGTKSGDISFSTNDADENPFNFRITGTVAAAAAPEIGVFGNGVSIADGDIIPSAADGTDFGSVPAGSTGVRTFTITNSGSGVLHLTGTPAVELLGSGGAFVVVQPPSALVSAGGSTSFQIAYTPAGVGLNGATVRIANDDGDENPYDFVIQGTGVQDPAAWVVSADAPKAIADQQTVVSTLTVSGRSGPVQEVQVQVNITHTWDADLDVYLLSPQGTRVELFTDVGSSGDNFTDTILDDQAGAGVASGSAPFTGTYRPEGALSALAGQDPNGIWRLEITDDAGGDVGTLHGWALRITTAAAQPQSVPYEQVFATGQPGAAAGWEYYSSNEGRIEVVGGRLRMDDAFGNATASLNEALLHVNLTGKTGVQLVLDHWSLSDENTPLATSFTGHYNGDGIALSVDGVHWVKVTDLTGSFTGQSFALDSVLLQAQMAAGSTDLSNVRIKFQQFDDYPSPDDGREFDNIRILTA